MRTLTLKPDQKLSARRRLLLLLGCSLLILAAVAGAAVTEGTAAAPVLDIVLTNNSSRDIYHFYISPADRNEWGPDLLDGRIVKAGETVTVNTVCPGNDIKLIAEDKTGCFMYQPAGCTQSSTEWVITNSTPADCGTE